MASAAFEDDDGDLARRVGLVLGEARHGDLLGRPDLLALVALTIVPVSVYGMKAIAGRARPRFLAQWGSTGALNAQIEEVFTGHAVVKSFGRQEQVKQRFDATNEKLYEASFRAQFVSGLIMPTMMFIGNLNYVVIAVVGGLLTIPAAIMAANAGRAFRAVQIAQGQDLAQGEAKGAGWHRWASQGLIAGFRRRRRS